MVESDYPHADSTWPDTTAVFDTSFGHLDDETRAKIAYRNAAELFRHPPPPSP
jgi:predicted TIM-barrel fold metal-dependent hydrolase